MPPRSMGLLLEMRLLESPQVGELSEWPLLDPDGMDPGVHTVVAHLVTIGVDKMTRSLLALRKGVSLIALL